MIPSESALFLDHTKNDRTGHLGHALVAYDDDTILAFYFPIAAVIITAPGAGRSTDDLAMAARHGMILSFTLMRPRPGA